MASCIKTYLVQDKSSHEGSGGGFSVVKFIHLRVENRTDATLQSVSLRYRLMKGDACFQESTLTVEAVGPGQTATSKDFIRESHVFDRIEWAGTPDVRSERTLSKGTVVFDGRIPGTSRTGCILALLGLILAVSATVYTLLRR